MRNGPKGVLEKNEKGLKFPFPSHLAKNKKYKEKLTHLA
jgi:hypothetical protein